MKEEVKVSVRNLIEFILRSGNLDNRFTGSSRAIEGTRAHQRLNREWSQKLTGYTPEVILSYTHEGADFNLVIEGRADGILEREDTTRIYEIKSTNRNLQEIKEDFNELHWAQAKVYAFFYAVEKDLAEISIQLTYYQLDTGKTQDFVRNYNFQELKSFFGDLIEKYLFWARFAHQKKVSRDSSIQKLDFPYQKYRPGQRKLAVASYRTITEGKKLFVQAPTGIGKTISTLFPAIKALGEGYSSKIFYLTAKTVTRQVAEDSIQKMLEKGLELSSVTITAKEKICFQEECECNPEYCPFAHGHFDRVNEAIRTVLENETIITRSVVEAYARNYNVCPFEFSLDLTLWADCIICDYNYVFDPAISLKRFFLEGKGDFIFLVDEAHNLVERARDMYSAELSLSAFYELKKDISSKNRKLAGVVEEIINHLETRAEEIKGDTKVLDEGPGDFCKLLRKFTFLSEEWLIREEKGTPGYELLLDQYFLVLAFLRIFELYDSDFTTYCQKEEDPINGLINLKIKLFCLDPSAILKGVLKNGHSAVFFSATLTPLPYYREVSGGDEDDYLLELPSPFDRDNLCLLVADNISTRYRRREEGYETIADYLRTTVDMHQGNYLVFFSSYEYLNRVYEIFVYNNSEVNTIIQTPEMTEKERLSFLNNFIPDRGETMVAFAVLGGVFSEGIDLKGERLSGTIIIGVGHPKICLERNLIRRYFQLKNGQGYDFAYTFPGMNKVLQAGGRTIRSEEDKGVILLIGERFNSPVYHNLFPVNWRETRRIVRSKNEIENNLRAFWK